VICGIRKLNRVINYRVSTVCKAVDYRLVITVLNNRLCRHMASCSVCIAIDSDRNFCWADVIRYSYHSFNLRTEVWSINRFPVIIAGYLEIHLRNHNRESAGFCGIFNYTDSCSGGFRYRNPDWDVWKFNVLTKLFWNCVDVDFLGRDGIRCVIGFDFKGCRFILHILDHLPRHNTGFCHLCSSDRHNNRCRSPRIIELRIEIEESTFTVVLDLPSLV